VTVCVVCGAPFKARSGAVGRPRTRCDGCRSNHARIDGSVWRALRRRVLAEEPVCQVPGCGRLSTEVDHIVPLAAGGAPLDRANLQGLCQRHNASKGASVNGVPPAPPHRRCYCGDPSCPGRWHL
jgi:5-methylcytosine-specific restriction endonuclease McrA